MADADTPPVETPGNQGQSRTGISFVVVTLVATVVGIWLVGGRAGRIDALVDAYGEERDKYIVEVCPPAPKLREIPPWAASLRSACLEAEPAWGTEEPATAALAEATLPQRSRSGVASALGRFIRTFNPLILLEIFVALTVAFFVLLGVRGGETPAETVLSRLGGPVRSRWVRTARSAAFVGLLLGCASLVGGTWASELRDERKMCHDTAVGYGHLLGIDRRCAQLQAALTGTEKQRDEQATERRKCEVELAQSGATLAANASISQTAGELAHRIAGEQDRSTRVVLESLDAAFRSLSKQVVAAQGDVNTLRAEAAKEKSLAALAKETSVKELGTTVAKQASIDTILKDGARQASLDELAKVVAREGSIDRAVTTLQGRLDELRNRQCLVKSDLSGVEAALAELRKPPAGTPKHE